jgi:uncharacterized protein (DUF4213/DUF364 family)
MNNKEMNTIIKECVKSVKKSAKETLPENEKIIDINFGLPYIAISLPNGGEYFFQGEEASNLLEEATNTGNKFNVSIEDAIIWQSQSW